MHETFKLPNFENWSTIETNHLYISTIPFAFGCVFLYFSPFLFGSGETPPATSTCSDSKLRATSLGSCCASNVTVSRRPQSKKKNTHKKKWGVLPLTQHNYFMILSYCHILSNFTKSPKSPNMMYKNNTNLEPGWPLVLISSLDLGFGGRFTTGV